MSEAHTGSMARSGLARRRFLRNAALITGVPALEAVLTACTANSASSTKGGSGSNPFDTPKYNFALINHVTTNSFFVPCRYGAEDACTLLGCGYTWSGSENNIVGQMVTAMDTAINRKVDGIGIPLIDPKAFNTATDKALDAGIPVIAYNTSAPSGSGNNAMAYVGQDLTAAGEAAGQHILKYVKKGDLVAGMIGVPGSLDEQPRIDGAKSVLTAAGVDFVEVGIGATQGPELSAVDSWYQGHQDVKFIYGVGSSEGIAVASTMKKYDLASKGIGGSSWDVGVPALQQVQAGHLAFTIDQQSYLQGFLTIMQLFLYQASGGMAHPVDTDTGLLFVNKDNVGPYLSRKDRFEGSTTSHQVTKAPSKISVGS